MGILSRLGHIFEELARTLVAASVLRRPLASSRIEELLYVSLGRGPPRKLEINSRPIRAAVSSGTSKARAGWQVSRPMPALSP